MHLYLRLTMYMYLSRGWFKCNFKNRGSSSGNSFLIIWTPQYLVELWIVFLDGVAINIQWKICQKSNYQLKVKETKSNPSSGAVKQTVLIAYFYVWLVNNNCCKVKLKLLVFDIFIWQQFADYSIFQYYCGFGHPEQVFSSSNPQVKKNDLCDSIT